MYSNSKFKNNIIIPKSNNNNITNKIDNETNNKKTKHDYETIRNIVLEKSNNNIDKYNQENNKPKNNKFSIV
jgi:hypothetical protein